MPHIIVENLVKTFYVTERPAGLFGAVRGLVQRRHRAVRALDGVQESALTARDGTTELAAVAREPRLVLPHLVRALVQHGATIESISPGDVTLEDVFLAKTGRSLQEDTRQR